MNGKAKKGINIGVVTIEEIKQNYTGDLIHTGDEIYDDAGKVRQYLYDSYKQGTVWVLLAGDASILPIRSAWTKVNTSNLDYIVPTDLYFADFNGNWDKDHDGKFGEPSEDDVDYLPELFVGRLLCSSPDDVSNWVTKSLKYEKNPGNGDVSYLTRSFMIQADQMQNLHQADSIANHLPIYQHTIWSENPSGSSLNPTFPKGADIIDELNSTKYGIMGWFNHGGTGGQQSGVTTLSSGIAGTPSWTLNAEDNFEYHNTEPETGDGLDNLTNYEHPFIIYSSFAEV